MSAQPVEVPVRRAEVTPLQRRALCRRLMRVAEQLEGRERADVLLAVLVLLGER